jgi:polysaccharide pyruvyl transferase WcaK-like protein
MKQLLLSMLLTVYIWFLRLRRGLGGIQPRSVLILPPAALGSLGDEAMVTATIEHLRDRNGINHVGLISYGTVKGWDQYGPVRGIAELQHHTFRGYWKALFRCAAVASRYERFYCLGADVLDGYYSERSTLQRLSLVAIAARIGANTAVLGFSFNEKPAPVAVEALRKLPSTVRLYARDPVSRDRLMSQLHRPINLVADLAFLLIPDHEASSAVEVFNWIEAQRSQGQIILGVNANYKLVQNLDVKELQNLVQVYVNTLLDLRQKNPLFSFVLIPHDFRTIPGEANDIELADAILQALPADLQANCIKMRTPCSAAAIKSVCGQLDMVVSGRMHLAIACLGQGTPAACITYQGKFEGLFQHLELDGMLIEPQRAVEPGHLVQFLLPLIERRDTLREHIQSKLPKIRQLAQANFA